jgi:hypothetical protein
MRMGGRRKEAHEALSPKIATLLFAAGLATIWLVLCPLIIWAISRTLLHFNDPWPLQEVVQPHSLTPLQQAEQVALYACLAMSVLFSWGAMELYCAQFSAAGTKEACASPNPVRRYRQAQREEAPRREAPRRRGEDAPRRRGEDAPRRRGEESAPRVASSHQQEEPQTSWVPEMTGFEQWDREARARQQERIDRLRDAVRAVNAGVLYHRHSALPIPAETFPMVHPHEQGSETLPECLNNS